MDLGGNCVQTLEQNWGAAAVSSVFIPTKRKRSDLSIVNGENGASYSNHKSSKKHNGFVMIDGQKGVYFSERWKPNGSTLYLPVSGSVLANMDKYDQISFEQGCFCIGDEAGRFQQKADGQTIHCWRYSEQDRKLFIALSYLFTNFQVFQEVLNSLDGL